MKNTILNKVSFLAKKSLTLCPPPFAGKVARGLCTILLLCASITGWAISEYCDFTHEGALSQGDSKITLSWNTNETGDVVITIGNATDNGHIITFRNNESPFETDGDKTLAPFTVLSGDGFATSEPANKYFSLQYTNGTTTFTMKRNGSYAMPSPAKIHFDGHAIAWYDSYEETTNNKWVFTDGSPKITFDYTYGTVCGSTLTAPVISVNSNGEVSFAAVDGADSYKAYVFQGSELIKTCPVTSGQKVWNPVLAGGYAIYVRAFNSSSDAYSDFSNSAIWNAAGDPSGDMPKSAVCGYGLKEGESEEAFLSFYTDRATGRFYITISAGERGDDSKTFFRDAGGLALGGFKYDGNTFTDYFTRIPESDDDINGKVNTLTFVPRTEEGHIPEYGHSITFSSGHYVTWRTYNNGSVQNPWADNLSFNYVYGSDCNDINDHVAPTVTVTNAATTTTSATLQIVVTDANDYGEAGTIRSITVRDEANDFAERKVTLNVSNQVALSDLTKNTIYNFTVKVTDEGGNVTEETIKVPLTFDPTANLALNKPCTGGYCQFNNSTEESRALEYRKANDGNTGESYSAYGAPSADEAWWQVDLESVYDVNQIKVYWASDYSTGYALYGSLDGTNWYLIAKDAVVEAGYKTTTVSAPARYIKVHSYNKKDVVFAEVEVYASGFSTLTDAQPVLTYAELLNVTDEEVTFEVGGVDQTTAPVQYYVTGIGGTQTVSATNNILTLSITPNSHYDVTIQTVDADGNKSTAKPFSFGSAGSITGIYLRGTFPSVSWGTGSGNLTDNAQLTTTAEAGIYSVTVAAAGGTNYEYKLYNVGESRWTDGDPSAVSSRYLLLDEAADVTIYAKSEDYFYSNYDAFVLTGTAVGEGEKALVWNADHTKATWVGTIVPEGTFMLSHTGGTHPFFASAQTFTGDYDRGMFTLDLATMTGTWISIGLILDESEVNSSNINGNHNRPTNVALTRSFTADNLYTLVLPFDLDAAQMAATLPGTMTKLDGVRRKANDDMYLNFVDVSSMEAGVAYLYTPSENVTNPVFENVVVKKDLVSPTISAEGYSATYTGIYDAISDVKATLDQSTQGLDNYVLGGDQWLYQVSSMPAETMAMNAFRGYFTLNFGTNAAPGRRARVVFGDIDDNPMATDLEELDNKQLPDKRIENGQLLIIRNGHTYNAQGQLLR